jgi:hypothetical protein
MFRIKINTNKYIANDSKLIINNNIKPDPCNNIIYNNNYINNNENLYAEPSDYIIQCSRPGGRPQKKIKLPQ